MGDFLNTVLEKNNPLNVQSVFYRNLLARTAVYYCFIVEGELAGVWGRYIPEIQDSLGLSDSLLGTSVLFYYLGNVVAAPIDAFLLKRFGSRFVTTFGAWCFILSMPLVALANSFGILTLATFAFGLSCGIMDISMNNSAILTEIVAGQPLLGSFHGSYSVAAALGSVLGGILVQEHFSTLNAFSMISGTSIFLSFITFYHMYDQSQEHFLTTFHKSHGTVDYAKVACEIQHNPLNNGDGTSRPQSILYEDDEVAVRSRSESKTTKSKAVYYETLNDNSLDAPGLGPPLDSMASAETVFVTPEQLFGTSKRHNRDDNDLEARTSDVNVPLLTHGDSFTKQESLSSPGMSSKSWRILSVFAAVGFLGAFGESSIVTWSVVFFERYVGASSVVKSLGFTCFMVCMGVGRFLCDYLRRVIGRRYMMRIGGTLAMGGLLLVVLSTELPSTVAFACLGFACTGLGLSTVIPTVFSSAGHLPGVRPGTALSIVAGCSYSGSIVSSPLVGLLSDSFDSLRFALLCDAILLGLIVPFSFGIIEETMVFQDAAAYERVQPADDFSVGPDEKEDE